MYLEKALLSIDYDEAIVLCKCFMNKMMYDSVYSIEVIDRMNVHVPFCFKYSKKISEFNKNMIKEKYLVV